MIKYYLSRGGVFRYAALMACLLWLAGSQPTVMAVNLISSSYSDLPAGAGEECAEIDDEVLCLSDDLNADSENRTVDEAGEDCADEGGDIGSGLVSVSIRLIGGDQNIFLGNDFVEPGVEIREDGVAVDTVYNDALDDDGGFDKNEKGNYWFEYKVTHLGVTRTDYRIVRVIGVTLIFLNGGTEKYIHEGSSFVDAGTFFDFTQQYNDTLMISDDTVDPNVVGAYPLTYNTLPDDQGNVYTVIYTVHVTDQPILEPIGVHPYLVSPGNDFNDPGAKLIDINGDILDTIYIGSPLTVSGANRYEKVEYSYTDGGSYSITIPRMIYVPYFDLDIAKLFANHNYPHAFLPKDIPLNVSFAGKSPGFFYTNELDEEITLKLMNDPELKSNHNPSVPGDYKVWFEYVDSQGDTLIYEEEFKVVENPALEFDIPNPFYFTKGEDNWNPITTSGYELKAYLKSNGTVIGNPAGKWMNPSYWTNPIGFNAEGTYNYTYAVLDINDNSINTTMTVHIVEPKFYLPNDTTIAVGSSYTLPDVRVTGTIAGSPLDTLAVKPTTISGWQNTAGPYEYEYTFTDSRGNTSTSVKFTVTVEGAADTTPPAVPVVTSTVISPANPVIEGTWDFDDIDSVRILLFSSDIDIVIEDKNSVQVNAGDNDAWLLDLDSVKASLFDGDVIYMDFYVFDNAGNEVSVREVEIEIDATPPAALILTTPVIGSADPVVQGTWNWADIEDYWINIKDDNDNFENDYYYNELGFSTNDWQIDLSSDVSHLTEDNSPLSVRIYLEDDLGNSFDSTYLVTIDNTPLTTEPIINPFSATTNDPTPRFEGTWGIDESGAYRMELYVDDSVSGTNIQSYKLFREVVLDASGSRVISASLGTGLANSPGMSGEADGTWTLDVPAGHLPVGTTLRVKASVFDEVGNKLDGSPRSLSIDITPPTAPTVDPIATNSTTTVTLTGTYTAEANATLTVEFNGTTYSTADGLTLDAANGTWSLAVNISSLLSDGDYEVEATYTDEAGNPASDDTILELTIDRTAPNAPTVNQITFTDNTIGVWQRLTGTYDSIGANSLEITLSKDNSNYVPAVYILGSHPKLTAVGDEWNINYGDGTLSNLHLVAGTYSIQVTSTDAVGNVSSDDTDHEIHVIYPGTDTDSDGFPDVSDSDDDGDGLLDADEENIAASLVARALDDDAGTAVVGQPITINVLDNDDFHARNVHGRVSGLVRSTSNRGTANGTPAFDPLTGILTYTPVAADVGDITIGYTVTSGAFGDIGGASASAEVTMTVGATTDTDGDGSPDWEDPDDDNDGILDDDDDDPLVVAGLADDVMYIYQEASDYVSFNKALFDNDDLFLNNTDRFSLDIVDTYFSLLYSDPISGDVSVNGSLSIDPKFPYHFDVLVFSPSVDPALVSGATYNITYQLCVPKDPTNDKIGGACESANVTVVVTTPDTDYDNDGNPDHSDPHYDDPYAEGETVTVNFVGAYHDIDVLKNDDFIAGDSALIINIDTDSSNYAGFVNTNFNGIAYFPPSSEIGSTVTIAYSVCHAPAGGPTVCSDTVELTVIVEDALDTDGDGLYDYIDSDDDNDGTPDDHPDPHPLEAVTWGTVHSVTYPGSSAQVTVPSIYSDFLNYSFVSARPLRTGTAGGRTEVLDPATGPDRFIYYPLESEIGKTVTLGYRLCNEAVSPAVCADSVININVLEPTDSDGDGVPDYIETTIYGGDPNIASVGDDEVTVPLNTRNPIDVLKNDDFSSDYGAVVTIIDVNGPKRIGSGPDYTDAGSAYVDDLNNIVYESDIRLYGVEGIPATKWATTFHIGYQVCHGTTCKTALLTIDVDTNTTPIWLKKDTYLTTSAVYTWNYVGIGTDVPGASLDVVGTTLTDDLVVAGNPVHPLIKTSTDDHYVIIDGHVHISDPDDAGEADRWAEKYDDFLFWVDGGLVSKDVAFADVEEGDWSDFVFEEDYDLPTLQEVEAHIKENGHLHTMPSEAEIVENGYRQTDINKRMLQTVEELTLHIIEQDKKAAAQQELIDKLLQRLESLESTVKK